MTEQYLQAHGYDVDKRAGMGSVVLRKAQLNGQVDLYWEYTGTSLITYNDVEERLGPEETYQRVEELDAEKGLVWLEASEANNTYALAMQEEDAAERGIESLSDLAEAINGGEALTVAVNAECRRPPGRVQADAAGVWLPPAPRRYQAHGLRADLLRAQGGSGGRGPGLCHRRTHPRLQLPRTGGRHATISLLRPHPGRAPGHPGRQPGARRADERPVGAARRRHHGRAQRPRGRGQGEHRAGG
ncbi:MAG: glycine betaine ABC transporter substrate-binding protein [Arhodomonas sp.]|nr:glycine betaine ABC transporter substrate-binding protein [Arhodomonas sp.]